MLFRQAQRYLAIPVLFDKTTLSAHFSTVWRSRAVLGLAATALCSVIISLWAAPGLRGVLGGGLAVFMLAIAANDARFFLIPDRLVLASLILGLLAAAVAQRQGDPASVSGAALRGSVLGLLFFSFRFVYRLVRGRDGLGLGDVKLASVAGVWLSWIAVSLAIDIAALAALASVLFAAARGRRFTSVTRVPFGLFFAPAIWLAWLIDITISRQIF